MSADGEERPLRRATRLVHSGRRPSSPRRPAGTAIYQTAPFVFEDVEELATAFADPRKKGVYSRLSNPTVEAAENCLAAAEGADEAVVFASGMAAIAATIQGLAGAGDRLLVARELYGGTRAWLDWLDTANPAVELSVRPLDGLGAAIAELDPAPRLVVVETPTNPLLDCCDLARLARSCHRHSALLVVDNTFATPALQNPLDLGADVVVHSASKYLAGHSDVIAGAVAGAADPVEQVRRQRVLAGGCLDPHAAFLVLRGMRTLDLRVQRQSENAARLAEVLDRHPRIEEVRYPGFDDVGRRQMRAGGGMVTVRLDDGAAARALLDRLELVAIVPSLGGIESGAMIPALTSHRDLDGEQRAALGITDGVVRISCGIEAVDDLEADLSQALDGLS